MNEITWQFSEDLFEYRDGDLFFKSVAENGVRGGQKVYLKDPEGYIYLQVDYKRYKAHRIIWVIHHGEIPEGMLIDHINGIRDCNDIDNLRLVTNSQNRMNTHAKLANTSSKYKGVHFSKHEKKWIAQISMAPSRKRLRIGGFKTEIEAAKAYNEAAELMFGEFAQLNEVAQCE